MNAHQAHESVQEMYRQLIRITTGQEYDPLYLIHSLERIETFVYNQMQEEIAAEAA